VSLAKGAHATTAIEGNTLSEDAVLAIVEQRPAVDAGLEYQVREVENVVNAYNWVLEEIRQGRAPVLSPSLVADFNRMGTVVPLDFASSSSLLLREFRRRQPI